MKKSATKSIITIISILIIFPAISFASERYFLLGVDVSGSYTLKSHSLKIVENFIFKEMKPGDSLVARRISEKSYIDSLDNMLLPGTFVLPKVGKKAKNSFDISAKKRYKKQLKKVQLYKIKAIKHLRSLKIEKALKTDIYGFFAVCSDRLSFTKGQTEKIIIIASDMQDNCARKSDIDLKNAKIVIIAFETDADPNKDRKLRQQWVNWLKKMNAGDIYFLSSDQDISVVL